MAEVRLTEVACFEFDVAVKRLFPIDVYAMLRQMAEEGMLQLVAREGKNRRQFSYGDIQFSGDSDTIYMTVPEAKDEHYVGMPTNGANDALRDEVLYTISAIRNSGTLTVFQLNQEMNRIADRLEALTGSAKDSAAPSASAS